MTPSIAPTKSFSTSAFEMSRLSMALFWLQVRVGFKFRQNTDQFFTGAMQATLHRAFIDERGLHGVFSVRVACALGPQVADMLGLGASNVRKICERQRKALLTALGEGEAE
jgi:hypothetical protein